MNLSLEVKLDTDEESSALELSVLIDGALDKVACLLYWLAATEPASLTPEGRDSMLFTYQQRCCPGQTSREGEGWGHPRR